MFNTNNIFFDIGSFYKFRNEFYNFTEYKKYPDFIFFSIISNDIPLNYDNDIRYIKSKRRLCDPEAEELESVDYEYVTYETYSIMDLMENKLEPKKRVKKIYRPYRSKIERDLFNFNTYVKARKKFQRDRRFMYSTLLPEDFNVAFMFTDYPFGYEYFSDDNKIGFEYFNKCFDFLNFVSSFNYFSSNCSEFDDLFVEDVSIMESEGCLELFNSENRFLDNYYFSIKQQAIETFINYRERVVCFFFFEKNSNFIDNIWGDSKVEFLFSFFMEICKFIFHSSYFSSNCKYDFMDTFNKLNCKYSFANLGFVVSNNKFFDNDFNTINRIYDDIEDSIDIFDSDVFLEFEFWNIFGFELDFNVEFETVNKKKIKYIHHNNKFFDKKKIELDLKNDSFQNKYFYVFSFGSFSNFIFKIRNKRVYGCKKGKNKSFKFYLPLKLF